MVVGKITPLSNASWNATVKTYNDAIPGQVSPEFPRATTSCWPT